MSYPLVDPDRLQQAAATHGTPLLLLSLRQAVNQYRSLAEALPGVELYYAAKALPHPALIKALDGVGACFDICTNGEIAVLQELGIAGDRCIHTHPIKRDKDIACSLDFGCDILVFDNIDELDKLEPYKDRCRLLLRLSFRSQDAIVDLSYKFGAAPDRAQTLLQEAHRRGFQLEGLSFHVGSQAQYGYKYLEAISFCRHLFNMAAVDGISLRTLDIGGGFPVTYTDPVAPISEFCRPIAVELERQFPDTRIIAEPGRYIAAPAMTLVSSVMGKAERSGTMWYYLDDGVYGSYSGKVYDHCSYQITPLGKDPAAARRPSVLAGPTCDSFDVIYDGINLPELEVGDLLASPMMGAYTAASASDFNLFDRAQIIPVDDDGY